MKTPKWEKGVQGATYNKAIEIDPRDASAYFNRGNPSMHTQQQLQTKAQQFRALKRSPGLEKLKARNQNGDQPVVAQGEKIPAEDRALLQSALANANDVESDNHFIDGNRTDRS